MTGLTSGLNHLTDISLDPRFAAVCGFTHEELDSCFGDRYPSTLETLVKTGKFPRMTEADGMYPDMPGRQGDPDMPSEAGLRQAIISRYGGYTWDGRTAVLNPYSVLRFFDEFGFRNFWMNTYPSGNFLDRILKANHFDFTTDKLKSVHEGFICNTGPGSVKPVPLLFHTGYLTIDSIRSDGGDSLYSFRVPNSEINGLYLDILSKAISGSVLPDQLRTRADFVRSVEDRDAARLTEVIDVILATHPSGPHMRESPDPAPHTDERLRKYFYHSLLFHCLYGIGLKPEAEESGSYGGADMVLNLGGGTVAVMELEYLADTGRKDAGEILEGLAKKGLKTIREKSYWRQYRRDGVNLVTIGLGVFGRGRALALFGDSEGAELSPSA
jgi:hypothetical protein